ncbi:MAG: arylsulfatase, partial [Tunicatimonas sp.]|uniref:arylsulfatase n=1 Tax=Tunicatimonas sp. TaxID=1940096 RepID=UPI003C7742F0
MRLANLLYCSLSLILFSCASSPEETTEEESRPNVLLIMTDDQGWGDVGVHGNPIIQTPVLDEFARNGVQIKNFYVSPLCAPTRASLLTGRYNLRTGTRWVTDGLENMNPEEVTLAEMFKSAGYTTGCFGKWHNGAHFPFHPNQQGFDEFIGFCAGHWNNYFNTTLQNNGKPFPTEGYITDVLTDQAIKFIEQPRDEPFFCYVPYNVPHGPFQVPDQYFEKYHAQLDTMSDEGERNKLAAVYGMCENMDANVGRLLSSLESQGVRDNTIVIFLTDNGPNGSRYNGGMRGTKGSTHEGGTRVPFFVQWPASLPTGSMVEGLAAHIDVLPTLAGLCNLPLPDREIDGVDLASTLMEANTTIPDRTLFFQQSGRELLPQRGAVRTNTYRLVNYPNYTGLYNLQSDPDESEDLRLEFPQLYDSLMSVYNEWFDEMKLEAVDMTVIPIGFAEQTQVVLPAHESYFSGNVSFKEGHGWAHDWLVNWTNSDDRIYWDVEVQSPFSYQVYLSYTVPESDAGATIQLEVGN